MLEKSYVFKMYEHELLEGSFQITKKTENML